MRGRHWVMTLATGFFVAGLAAGGCGGSTSSGSPPDAGAHDSATADVTIDQLVGDAPAGDAPVDAGSDDVTDAGCESGTSASGMRRRSQEVRGMGTRPASCTRQKGHAFRPACPFRTMVAQSRQAQW